MTNIDANSVLDILTTWHDAVAYTDNNPPRNLDAHDLETWHTHSDVKLHMIERIRADVLKLAVATEHVSR